MSSEHSYLIGQTDTETDRSLGRFTDVEATLLSMQEIVGRKWHPIVIHQLLVAEPLGFSSLKDRIDRISSKMLSKSLDDLEAAGLVDRTLLSDRPVRVEYALTERGQSLEPLIEKLLQWGTEHDIGEENEASTDSEYDDVGPTVEPSLEDPR